MGWLCIFRAFSHLNSHLKLLLAFQAYLSLPEGTASVAGLIAMMTDHYCNMVILGIYCVLSQNLFIYFQQTI